MLDYDVTSLLDRLRRQASYPAFATCLAGAKPGERIGPLALPEAVQPAIVATAALDRPGALLWVVAEPDEARVLADALQAYLGDERTVRSFPAPDAMPHERIAWDPATREQRMSTLTALWRARRLVAGAEGQGGGPGPNETRPDAERSPLVVASLRGLLTRTLSPEDFEADSRVLALGQRIPITALLQRLARLGYESVSQVGEAGQVAHRGGIVDIYPPAGREPLRLEWFGDEIDSIRAFDPDSQRSSESLECCWITPAGEALPSRGPEIAARVADHDVAALHPLAASEWRRHVESLEAGQRFSGLELFTTQLHPAHATVLDHLPADTLIVADDLPRLEALAQGLLEQAEVIRREQIESGELPADWAAVPVAPWSDLTSALAEKVHLRVGRDEPGRPKPGAAQGESSIASEIRAPERFGGQVEDMVLEILGQLERGESVVLISRQAPRIAELFGDAGRAVASQPRLQSAPGAGGLAIVHGALGAGWRLAADPAADEPPLTVLTDGEIFGWRMPHRRRRARDRQSAGGEDFSEFAPGDFIVHIEHGIGVFRGLERMAPGEVERDYLVLEYASGDVLYVPTHQADRVARYVGAGELTPAITRLGTADWERAKARAKREVEDIAEELLALYARRETLRRAAFSSDTPWQAEMEAAFPFAETDDQLRAIEAVKRDMESQRPMDRLVVGDVGFGKTEVALRAAFKAVMDGRQVAVLAPTTVLAQQHYETFRQRMSAFPVRIEVLSRFRKRREQQDVLEALAQAELDVVIGTHRLLSADVRFKDLGLLIIDEEHRFGVKHKERLRQMAEGVDTLTLTATPIPRTMHLALTGLRDLTKIDTPPSERLPVVTHVGAYDDTLVRQALRRELGRRGQVFYVSHRVRGIGMIEQKLRRLVPEARTAVAHGQLAEAKLARAMLEFVSGQVDVLVCTSIIESGLDIPNANTLIVERADRFGLAQLHQLRGRVGRSAQRAYAYLLHPTGWELPLEARRRLQALADHDDLGAGFRLAMRDLEIRGAGEILGARQHGQVAAIGLDLYTKLLAEAIKRVRADREQAVEVSDSVQRELEAIDPGTLPTVDLPLDAYLPEEYIAETRERTRVYRRMATASRIDDVDEIARELRDRFGPPPEPVSQLLEVLRLRVLAHVARAQSVGREGEVVAVRWKEDHALRRTALREALGPEARIGRHRVALPLDGSRAIDLWLPEVRSLLEAVAACEGRPQV